jgi:hypothetical protein
MDTTSKEPLVEQAYAMGKEFAKIYGGSWKQHAYEIFVYQKTAYGLIMEKIKEDGVDWNALTQTEKADVSSEVLQILADKNKVMTEARRLGVIN